MIRNLDLYRELLTVRRRILTAKREGDWAALAVLETKMDRLLDAVNEEKKVSP